MWYVIPWPSNLFAPYQKKKKNIIQESISLSLSAFFYCYSSTTVTHERKLLRLLSSSPAPLLIPQAAQDDHHDDCRNKTFHVPLMRFPLSCLVKVKDHHPLQTTDIPPLCPLIGQTIRIQSMWGSDFVCDTLPALWDIKMTFMNISRNHQLAVLLPLMLPTKPPTSEMVGGS